MSIYSVKSPPQGVQAWQSDLLVGKGIFDYYDSQGDAAISMAAQIPCVQDGPMVARRYNNLTISAQLTTQYRCRGLLLLVDGNLTVSSGGDLSMTARGAAGHSKMGLYDMLIPDRITLASKRMSQRDVLASLRSNGYAIIDRWLWDDWGKIDGMSATAWAGGMVLLSAAGCGVGKVPQAGTTNYQATSGAAGINGGAGAGAPGCIHSAGATTAAKTSRGGSGRPWGGGAGGGGQTNGDGLNYPYDPNADDYGGKGGDGMAIADNASNWVSGSGAGNTPGVIQVAGSSNSVGQSGTGGCLYVICKGNILISLGGLIEADGKQGGVNTSYTNYFAPGGSSGGGHVSLIYGGTYTNNGTVRANGGAAGVATLNQNAGGAGSVVTKTFGQMGW
ncbi:hypothetical protein [Fundidesulfovibrio terrae]|uniref:hypothetical protein n=1 Tax=Fundidesulfovibrio terrae TaxID=2922866 RepID=UPI001FAF22DA|nr:hypothetical protein [Fundidesulfovibrio terrae]